LPLEKEVSVGRKIDENLTPLDVVSMKNLKVANYNLRPLSTCGARRCLISANGQHQQGKIERSNSLSLSLSLLSHRSAGKLIIIFLMLSCQVESHLATT
jgi:hypothetical protein